MKMRTKYYAIGLAIGFAALVLYSRARADEPVGPPPQGSYVSILQPMISCDAREQIEQIAQAKLQSDEAAQAKFDEFHAIVDKEGEGTCMFGKLQTAVAVGESSELPDLRFGDVEVKAYAVHVGTAHADWWCMYIIPKSSKKDTSI